MKLSEMLNANVGNLPTANDQYTKMVNWQVVRNLANALTNQLDLAGDQVDIEQAHMSCFDQGPVRGYTLETVHGGHWRDASWNGQGWMAFEEADVSRLRWESMTSGSGLEARKVCKGLWTLTFIPSVGNPEYRGDYFRLFVEAEKTPNIDEEYVRPDRTPKPGSRW